MSVAKDTVGQVLGDATDLVYETVGDAIFGPPAGGIIGSVAGDVADDIGQDTFQSFEDLLDGDLSALPDMIEVATDPLGVANQHLVEKIPIIGDALSKGIDLFDEIPGADLLHHIF